MLCLAFVLSGFSVTAYATDSSDAKTTGSSSDSIYDSSEVIESLNTISYAQYLKDANAKEASGSIVVDAIADLYAEGTTAAYQIIKADGKDALLTPATGTVAWKVTAPKRALYTVTLVYYAYVEEGEETKAESIERVFKINGKIPFSEARNLTIKKNWLNDYPDAKYLGKGDKSAILAEGTGIGLKGQIKDGELTFEYPNVWTAAISNFCEKYAIRFMKLDIYNNEIRPTAFQSPVWSEYTLTDSMGFYTEAFTFLLEEGENVISIDGKNADLAISEIIFSPSKKVATYAEYAKKYEGQPNGTGSIKTTRQFKMQLSGILRWRLLKTTIWLVPVRLFTVLQPRSIQAIRRPTLPLKTVKRLRLRPRTLRRRSTR